MKLVPSYLGRFDSYNIIHHGPIAQLVEHRNENPSVASSILARPTIYRGVEKRLSHLAHNQETVGSNPTSATILFVKADNPETPSLDRRSSI